MKRFALFALLIFLPGCSLKRHWVSSEQAYDRWMINACEKSHPAEECDPNWKPCTAHPHMEGEAVCN